MSLGRTRDASEAFLLLEARNSRLRYVLLSVATSTTSMLLSEHRACGASEEVPLGRPMGGEPSRPRVVFFFDCCAPVNGLMFLLPCIRCCDLRVVRA